MSKISYKKFKDSSVIHSAAWHEETEGLIIIFNSGSIWHYDDVSYDSFYNFITAKSAGSFFNSHIRNSLIGTCIFKKGAELEQEKK